MDAGADGDSNVVALQPKRTTSFAATAKGKKGDVAPSELIQKIERERENSKYWAKILLLFPLAPMLFAMTTAAVGGVVINVASSTCNTQLLRFMQGAVVLSHMLIIFYSWLWLGGLRIRSLRLLRVIYFIFGLLCFIWWGLYGTLQAVKATNSGFQSCLSTAPTLYILSQFEVAGFWILFLIFVGYIVQGRLEKAREAAKEKKRNREQEEREQKEKEEAEVRDKILNEAREKARLQEEEQRKQLAAEQDQLFGDNDEDDAKVAEPEEADAPIAEGGDEEGDDDENQGYEDGKDGGGATGTMSAGANGQTITVCGNVFRLVETIGRGSYGTVHKAVNLSSGAAVAVKMIGKDKLRRPHERQSIEKEIETMRVAVEQFENGHPHIVRLLCTKADPGNLDLQESQHHIFIVLEYCAGGDISDLIKSSRGLSEQQARLYMSQLASGLQFLRSQNVVHRDLKPANLLLSSKNAQTAKLKIADFGFARELKSESMAESVVGSPLYMAPELLEYKSYDAKADLWSVGIILYEMLVNDHPFLVVDRCHATNHLALRKNIYRYFERNKRLRLPSHISVSPECAEVLEGLLRVDPRERISFEEFFRASFILPPPPVDPPESADLTGSASSNRQALVAEKQPEYDDLSFSDEYVIVDKEYEDVGRKVLDAQDLNIGAKAAVEESKPPQDLAEPPAPSVPEVPTSHVPVTPIPPPAPEEIKDSYVAASSPPQTIGIEPSNATVEPKRKGVRFAEVETPSPDVHDAIAGGADWISDDNRLEELLGICYKSFSCGSVALFVPTPFGDYIAFHEGCPHYYLSMESIEAFKRDGSNPSYVLGTIVFIEDYESTTDRNPFCLREGTTYHVVTVTPLSDGQHATSDAKTSLTDELPLSQVLSSRSPRGSEPTGSFSTSQLPSTTTVHQRISFRTFQISHLVLFFLRAGKLPYVAFNEGAPHYYLANESIQAARAGDPNDKLPAYICGEIIFIDSFQATEDFNPYRLPYGTRFHVVTVANPKRT
ncbi:TPA: hypothetical protein N0F65_010263 [Lagenidium giganteum]|uniref:Protein kinase domain-containing protein n=1 Tax=Lagenidium giganteum TaxID=4803 RepID=A0AAV2YNM0_9STRA|nr:TPA: hypothetical protein N0F65_010263 [Lagenidium giganteum]